MHVLVGLDLVGATLTPHDDLAPDRGAVGRPVWGPGALLRDLEMRLGLPESPQVPTLRVLRWAARMRQLAPRGRFYSRSFEVDAVGTAKAVLELRDELVGAGWDGRVVEGGGPRLDAICELEEVGSPALPLGVADRVAQVARSLEASATRLYESVTLGEPLECWSSVWQRVLRALEWQGTELGSLDEPRPAAPVESDLGKVQWGLWGEHLTQAATLRGDGSVLVLEADTVVEAASATAALLATYEPSATVVIRERDEAELDQAMLRHGLPTQGVTLGSRSRALLQLLPLAVELAYEPKDPERVLELLSLPVGPFRGRVRRGLMQALFRAPGIGGKPWQEAKGRLAEPREEVLGRIAEWFEQPGADRHEGAATGELLAVVERVRAWLVGRVSSTPNDSVLHAAVAQCQAFAEALVEDGRPRWDLISARRWLDFCREPVVAELSVECSGRAPCVSSPASLRTTRGTVVWWSFVHAPERPSPSFRAAELAAMREAGWSLPDSTLLLAERARSFRRAALLASERLVLVVPRSAAGVPLVPHPLWDELVARLQLTPSAQALVTRSPSELLAASGVRVNRLTPLSLPAPTPEWQLRHTHAPTFAAHSASSLDSLLGCPLQWALGYWAQLRSEERDLPEQHVLSGTLGHRLVEELHAKGAFSGSLSSAEAASEAEVDRLLEQEGALFLQPGKSHELEQVRQQLVRAACELIATLRNHELEVVAMEKAFEVPWGAATLRGRWDLVVRGRDGRRAVIDLKWGKSTYEKKLTAGNALQLAAYVHALQSEAHTIAEPGARASEPPEVDAAYFSLKARRMFALPGSARLGGVSVPGPALDDTWRRVERTLPVVQAAVTQGRLHATGLSTSEPLLEALGVPDGAAEHYVTPSASACEYCAFDALCGRRWEGLS